MKCNRIQLQIFNHLLYSYKTNHKNTIKSHKTLLFNVLYEFKHYIITQKISYVLCDK